MRYERFPALVAAATVAVLRLASAAESAGGLSLLTEGNARAASLGQAFTAAADDVAGMAYNPASLATLGSGQASFLYKEGLLEDAQGRFMGGVPGSRGTALGLQVGYYDAGEIETVDAGGGAGTISAQTDLVFGFSIARRMSRMALGATAKVLRSTIVEQFTATAYALDVGVHVPLTSRLRIGAAALNYGTAVRYASEGEPLPRMVRAGASYLLVAGPIGATLLLDAPYMMIERELTPSAGVETNVNAMSFRVGYRGGTAKELSAGAGFGVGQFSLDYAYGLVGRFGAQHKVSMGFRFGAGRPAPSLTSTPPALPVILDPVAMPAASEGSSEPVVRPEEPAAEPVMIPLEESPVFKTTVDDAGAPE